MEKKFIQMCIRDSSDLDYDHQGGIIRMNLEGLESPFTWQYDQSSGFLHHLTYPNGMVRCNTYHRCV